jgi:hypothetical protein
MSSTATVFSQSFFHGTRADLKPGDLIVVGHQSNFTDVEPLSWVYFAATLDAAIWGRRIGRRQRTRTNLCRRAIWADHERSEPNG